VPNDVLVSLEFLHGYLLIHDDIMDRDEQRYGGSTVWASYFQNLQGIGDDERRNQISEGLAILGGDLLSTFMREPILHSTVPAGRKVELLQVVHDGENDTAKGQILDVYSSISMPTCDEVRELYRLKTSRYSIAIPLLFGAVLAGDEQHQNRTAIIHYADPLGIAFQIYDDLLGVSGDPSVTGKSDSTDLHQQKKTMLIITTIEHLPPADQAQFLELFYKERKEPADITRLKEMIAISQARETLEKEMQGLIVEAKAAIDAITWNQEAKDMLFQFADFVVRRRR
jgi:geranylgeranyl diphosphate synthase type I